MLKYLSLIFVLVLFTQVIAEESPSTSLDVKNNQTDLVFAVGKAKLEKERIIIAQPIIVGELSKKTKADLEELNELIINDLSFYKGQFDLKISGQILESEFRKTNDTESGVVEVGNYKIQMKANESKA